MDHALRELLVARVCSGTTRLRLADRRGGERAYVLRRPTRERVYLAAELYIEVLRQAELDGLYSEDELSEFLVEQGLWDEARQKAVELLPRQIEDSKVALYKATFRANERKVVRRALALARAELARLTEERNAYAHLTCSGAAGIARARYLVGAGLHTACGRRVFPDDDFWEDDSPLLDEAMAAVAAARVGEGQVRELARTDPWRTVWNGNRVERCLFGVPPADWTDEQRSLVNWSLLYDNVYQHPDCPPDPVVEDDDLVDGWLIVQRRARERRLNANDGEHLVGNEKVRGSQEVYLVADTADDARGVVGLNDEYGRDVQRRRFGHLAKKGTVNELEMPDTAMRLRTEVTQKLAAAVNSNRG